MDHVKKPSVVVCVTGQKDCDRLIKEGCKKAQASGYELHVLNVHNPEESFSARGEEFEHLYRTAKTLGADMTILFGKNAPAAAAGFMKKVNAKEIVTGMPDGRPNGFIVLLHELMPALQLTMVTKQYERLIYNNRRSDKAYA